MQKIKNNIIKVILIVFVLMFIWIIFNSILQYEVVMYSYNPIIIIIGIAVYLLSLMFIWKKIIPKISQNKYIPIIFILLFSVISFVIGLNMKVRANWDMGFVHSIAKHIVMEKGLPLGYLHRHPNNLMLTIIYIIVFKIAMFFDINDFLNVATCFNAILIIATVVLIYLVTRKIYGKDKSLFILIIALFTTPLYLQVPIYYSDSISMFLTILMLYVLLRIIESDKSVFLQIALAAIIFMAMKVKITSIILIIASIIYYFLNKKIEIKDIKKIFLSVIILITLLVGYEILEDKILEKSILNTYQFPIEYGILTGLEGNGNFSWDVYTYTNSFKSYDEKEEALREMIHKKLAEYDIDTFISHIAEKLKFTYSDGTYYAPYKLANVPVEENILHEIVLIEGKYSNYYKYFPQVMHYSMLILIVVSAYSMLKEKRYRDIELIFILSVIGITIFLLLWENRSRYILAILPIMMILQISGFDYIVKKSHKKHN